MRMLRSAAALALVSTLPLVLSCSPSPLGEIVLAIRTDIAIPKDVDRIVIDVTLAQTGESKFHQVFSALEPDHTFKLPATLGFSAPKDPSAAVRVRVLALRGDDDLRLIREVVTTVPPDRTVTLPIPIEFLCDQTAETVRNPTTGKPVRTKDGDLVFKNTCADGTTCVAGKCVDATVPVETLVDYDGAQVFGGGTGHSDGDCFDAASCFDGAALVDVDPAGCTIPAGQDVNVALLTQGAGMCGASGCFVPLDAESDAGWQPGPEGLLKLPQAVCAKIQSGVIGGVVTAPAGKSPCSRKQSSLPICGPFSSAGAYVKPSQSAPIVVASGQQNPVALAVAGIDPERVYWTTRGTFDPMNGNPKSDGAVKRAQTTGEEAVVIAAAQASPHDLVVSPSKGFVFWTNASGGAIWASALDAPKPASLFQGSGRPEGIALDNLTLTWTDLTSDLVSQAVIGIDMTTSALSISAPKTLDASTPAALAPRRVAASPGLACWTYEDKLGSTNGVVACNDGSSSTAVATLQATPRAIALVGTGPGAGTVYFADFAARGAGGGVYSVASNGGTPALVNSDGEDYPNGIAVDGDVLYWTSRTRGAVMRLKGTVLTEIASHQQNPGAIVVGADAIFWVNEGTVDKPDGAIVRLAR